MISGSFDNSMAADIDLNNYLRENPIMIGCVLASSVIGDAAYRSFVKHKRATLSTRILEEVGPAFESLVPATTTPS